ncbi:TRAP transporter large permease [Salinicola rhizosphaerae]|uniref:TRAP transporter large permease protein n=1 Tax=Salinicola rhizosphaerae TaxID=1443141 RepID=A0ABQ3DRM3_9GAMM|nr:TRAP transporter large permease [Salinicola rhizosphaerae]GHB11131.1 C4-dicarboxylate ABC transporter permease [Salinicola rhizosphaerae]
MDFMLVGIVGVAVLLTLLMLGVPLAINFLLVGFVGIATLLTPSSATSLLGDTMYTAIASPTFTVLPLFVLMGALAAASGFAERAYKGIHRLAARMPGSLAVATAFGSAAFSTVCGSSLATASVFGRIAYPEMRRYRYDKRFALGSIACSGSLAAMIPPSGMFILFSIFTGVPVGKLFMAGILPGILTALVYAISIVWRAKRNPDLAPTLEEEQRVVLRDRLRGIVDLWQILLLGGLVIGGMYGGLFTATEAGAIGALGALVLGVAGGPLRKLEKLRAALRESAGITTTLFFIIIAALFFSRFLGLTRIPFEVTNFMTSWDVPSWMILGLILLIWFLMGMVVVPAAAFALTLPIVFPIVTELGYHPVWFCVIAMKMCEVAGVTPPVGLNAFALAGAAGRDVKISEVFSGVWPFVVCEIVVLAILLAFPAISLWLPETMM